MKSILFKNCSIALCWVLLVFAGTLQAQSVAYDSLLGVVDTIPEDTDKVIAYLHATKALMFIDGEGAMKMGEKARTLAKQVAYPFGEAEAMRMQGIYYIVNGASELALERFQKSSDLFQQIGDKKAVLRCSNNFATVYMELEQYDTALTYLLNYKKAAQENRADSLIIVTMRHNEGICLDLLGHTEEAYEVFKTNLVVLEHLNSVYEQSFTNSSMGETLLKLGRPQEAVLHFRNALALKQQLGDQRGIANNLVGLAEAYHGLGQEDSAIAIGHRGLDLAVQGQFMETVSDASKHIAKIHADLGQSATAYALLHRHVTLKDSLNKSSTSAKVMSLQTAYGLKHKNLEIQQLQQATALDQAILARQQILILSMALGIALVLILLLLIYRASAARARLNTTINAKNEALSETNAALQRSIQEREALVHMVIHDLKSPLNSTDALIVAMRDIEGIPPLAIKMMDKIEGVNRRGMTLISDLLGLYEIENQGQVVTELVTCAQIVDSLILSMERQAIRKGLRITSNEISPSLTIQTNASMVMRILENLVSNGLKFSPKDTEVQVQCQDHGHEIVFAVQDQGPGISVEDQGHLFQRFMKLTARPTGGEHSNGLGLAIVKQLAERLGGKVGVESELGKGARFWVSLPKGHIHSAPILPENSL